MTQRPTQPYDAYIFDLDGTVYLGDALLPTVHRTITLLRSTGKRTVFLSKNPSHAILNLLQLAPERCIMTGDRLETDVQMGLNAGMAAALTLTGATTLQDAALSSIKPHFMLNDLGDLLPQVPTE